MNLTIEQKTVNVMPEITLLQMIRQLGLDEEKLSRRPLAAKIAGEIFTLNYVPMRHKDLERAGIRAAVAASNGNVKLLRYTDAAGKELYTRTAQFVIFLALNRLWPDRNAKVHCTIGSGLFIELDKPADYSVEKLKSEIRHLIEADIPLLRIRTNTQEAR